MDKIKLELEIILVAKYCEILKEILKHHKNLSLNKILVFSFLIKKRNFNNKDVYSAKNKHDLVLKSISLLAGAYDDYCREIKYIIEAIDLLIKNNKIFIEEGILCYVETGEKVKKNNSFINKAIEESKEYSDRQFLKEVIESV